MCAFMGCCDSIPQVCFKVAATARFFKTKWQQGLCVCVRLWVAVTASHRFVFKVAATARFFKTKCCCGFVCVCAFMGCCDSIPQVCFKVAATAHFSKQVATGCVCVCIYGLL